MRHKKLITYIISFIILMTSINYPVYADFDQTNVIVQDISQKEDDLFFEMEAEQNNTDFNGEDNHVEGSSSLSESSYVEHKFEGWIDTSEMQKTDNEYVFFDNHRLAVIFSDDWEKNDVAEIETAIKEYDTHEAHTIDFYFSGKDILLPSEFLVSLENIRTLNFIYEHSDAEIQVQNMFFEVKSNEIMFNVGFNLVLEGNGICRPAIIVEPGCILHINNISFRNFGSSATVIKNGSTLIMTDSEFENNESDKGGAIFLDEEASLVTVFCTFNNNKAECGGAIYISNNSHVEFHDSVFIYNYAEYDGGALYANESQIFFTGETTADNNIAVHQGGFIYIQGNGEIPSSPQETSEQPTIDPIKVGRQYITGTGIPLSEIEVTFPDNSKQNAVVDTFSMWRVVYNNMLSPYEVIYAIQTEQGKLPSLPAMRLVEPNTFHFSYSDVAVYSDFFDNPINYMDLSTCLVIGQDRSMTTNLSNNTALQGGAIYASDYVVVDICNADFVNNKAFLSGGAIYNNDLQFMRITDSLFNSNSAAKLQSIINDYDKELHDALIIDSGPKFSAEQDFAYNNFDIGYVNDMAVLKVRGIDESNKELYVLETIETIGDQITLTPKSVEGYTALDTNDFIFTIDNLVNIVTFKYRSDVQKEDYTELIIQGINEDSEIIYSEKQTVLIGKTYVIPAPVVTGYSLNDDAEKQIVVKEIENTVVFLYAKVSSSGGGGTGKTYYYTVRFDTNGGSKVPSQRIARYAKAKEPNAPTKKDSTFDGWYLDNKFTDTYDFDLPVTKDLTLYAKWIKKNNNTSILSSSNHRAYIVGYPDGNFGPEKNTTRAEAAAMIYRIAFPENVRNSNNNTRFTDIPKDAWYYDAILALDSFDLIDANFGTDKFHPDLPITRAEFVSILMRYMDYTLDIDIFPDVTANHFAYNYITGAVEQGIITGYPDGTFKPDAHIKRAEITSIINRALGCDEIESGNTFPDVSSYHWAFKSITAAATNHNH